MVIAPWWKASSWNAGRVFPIAGAAGGQSAREAPGGGVFGPHESSSMAAGIAANRIIFFIINLAGVSRVCPLVRRTEQVKCTRPEPPLSIELTGSGAFPSAGECAGVLDPPFEGGVQLAFRVSGEKEIGVRVGGEMDVGHR